MYLSSSVHFNNNISAVSVNLVKNNRINAVMANLLSELMRIAPCMGLHGANMLRANHADALRE